MLNPTLRGNNTREKLLSNSPVFRAMWVCYVTYGFNDIELSCSSSSADFQLLEVNIAVTLSISWKFILYTFLNISIISNSSQIPTSLKLLSQSFRHLLFCWAHMCFSGSDSVDHTKALKSTIESIILKYLASFGSEMHLYHEGITIKKISEANTPTFGYTFLCKVFTDCWQNQSLTRSVNTA